MPANNISSHNEGFIAIMTAIILSVILMTLALELNSSAFFARSAILDAEYKERSRALAEACADTALLRLSINPAYAGNETIAVGDDACSILGITFSGGRAAISASASFQNTVTNVSIITDEVSLSILSWEEVPYL